MTNPATVALWAVIGFFSGSLMFSSWLARWALGRDLRNVGDGNPGASNALKAGGWKLGVLALVLDALKGAIPVSIARYGFGMYGLDIVIVAIATVLGHAYSPWMDFKGGKAVAVTMGVWMAITLWEAPMLGGITLGIWYSVVTVSGWAVLLTTLTLLAYYLITNPDPVLLTLWVANVLILVWKYRADFRKPPGLRPWILKWLRRS
jgi:acyl phosphate:glycerol-3-phosphate acyltransferase